MIRNGSMMVGIHVVLGGVNCKRPIKTSCMDKYSEHRVPHDKPGQQLWGVKGSVGAALHLIGCSGVRGRCRCSMQQSARHRGVAQLQKGVIVSCGHGKAAAYWKEMSSGCVRRPGTSAGWHKA